jgi:CDP-diacylglycerol--glycerol-3-phosphate 3-phosphatidyltransferase
MISAALVPWTMIGLRAALCPLILWATHTGWIGRWLAAIVLFALVDDIYDGILARHWNCDTPTLRLADSIADTIFYLGVLGALWMRKPEVLRSNRFLFAAVLILEASRYLFDLSKFGKAASYHSYMAKAWGLLLAAAMVGVFAFDSLRSLVPLALLWGIAVNLEGLTMSMMLPRWKNDVKTVPVAWRLRRQMLSEEPVSR